MNIPFHKEINGKQIYVPREEWDKTHDLNNKPYSGHEKQDVVLPESYGLPTSEQFAKIQGMTRDELRKRKTYINLINDEDTQYYLNKHG